MVPAPFNGVTRHMLNRKTTQLVRSLTGAAAIAGCITCTGCSSNHGSDQVTQQTINKTIVSTPLCDLGVDAGLFPEGQSIHVVTGNLPALMPMAGIAVTRVRCDGALEGRPLQAEPIAPERAALWNQLVNDLARVREFVVLGTLGMDPRGAKNEDLLDAAKAQDCNYCLIYQLVDPFPYSASVRAVLWDTDSRKPLISFNTAIQLPESVVQQCNEDEDMTLRREADASYQVEAELRGMVRDTLWDMAGKTEPNEGPTSRPNPWKTDQPILPRDDYRYRRYLMRGGE